MKRIYSFWINDLTIADLELLTKFKGRFSPPDILEKAKKGERIIGSGRLDEKEFNDLFPIIGARIHEYGIVPIFDQNELDCASYLILGDIDVHPDFSSKKTFQNRHLYLAGHIFANFVNGVKNRLQITGLYGIQM
jgi:hypothetical protein